MSKRKLGSCHVSIIPPIRITNLKYPREHATGWRWLCDRTKNFPPCRKRILGFILDLESYHIIPAGSLISRPTRDPPAGAISITGCGSEGGGGRGGGGRGGAAPKVLGVRDGDGDGAREGTSIPRCEPGDLGLGVGAGLESFWGVSIAAYGMPTHDELSSFWAWCFFFFLLSLRPEVD